MSHLLNGGQHSRTADRSHGDDEVSVHEKESSYVNCSYDDRKHI